MTRTDYLAVLAIIILLLLAGYSRSLRSDSGPIAPAVAFKSGFATFHCQKGWTLHQEDYMCYKEKK